MGGGAEGVTGLLAMLASLLFKLGFVIVVIGILIQGFTWLISGSANDFCEGLGDNENLESVVKKAGELGYRTYSYERGEDLILSIPDQDSPLFRMACVVTFTDGLITAKEVVADD